MVGFETWRRRLASMFAATLLAVLVVAPSFDAGLCLADCAQADSTQISADQSVVTSDDVDGHSSGSGLVGSCVHGHCHHVNGMAGPSALSEPVSPTASADLPQVEFAAPPSQSPSGPERPPRA